MLTEIPKQVQFGEDPLILPECFYFIFPALQMEQRSFEFWELWKVWAHEVLLHILINYSSLCISPDIFSDKLYQKMPLWQWAGTEKKGLKIYKYQQAIQSKRKRYSMYDATYGYGKCDTEFETYLPASIPRMLEPLGSLEPQSIGTCHSPLFEDWKFAMFAYWRWF